jgi:hypothetical protein
MRVYTATLSLDQAFSPANIIVLLPTVGEGLNAYAIPHVNHLSSHCANVSSGHEPSPPGYRCARRSQRLAGLPGMIDRFIFYFLYALKA